MKKLVIKTTLITFVSFVCTIVAAFGAFAIFAPGSVAGFFDGVGNYSASVFFYEKQFEKSGDIRDLKTLVDKINRENDLELAEKYLALIVNHEDFDAFCEDEDAKHKNFTTKEYYVSEYALSLDGNGKLSEALSVSESFVTDNGYTKNNPFRFLVAKYANSGDAESKTAVKTALESVGKQSFAEQQQLYLDEDLENIK